MFDNLLFQDASVLLSSDILEKRLPQSILLLGPAFSGKLTCALEIARLLSCQAFKKGDWTCVCPSCLKHKSLVGTDMLLAGNRSCSLEIAAAKQSLLKAASQQVSYLQASRYLFVRSIRKLTSRFNQVLWEADDKLGKIAPLTAAIDELLEEIDPLRPLPEFERLEKICNSLILQCDKLESGFMYDNIPVSQVRKAALWARYTSGQEKRIIIFENAQYMQEGAKNALLKILEEPPEQSIFILLAQEKSALMPTILSRVRPYVLAERTIEQQTEVVQRIFHPDLNSNYRIGDYLYGFLPAPQENIFALAQAFISDAEQKKIPDIETIIKDLKNFDSPIVLKLFFNHIMQIQRSALIKTPSGFEQTEAFSAANEKNIRLLQSIKRAYSDITVFNQAPASSLEGLAHAFIRDGIQ